MAISARAGQTTERHDGAREQRPETISSDADSKGTWTHWHCMCGCGVRLDGCNSGTCDLCEHWGDGDIDCVLMHVWLRD